MIVSYILFVEVLQVIIFALVIKAGGAQNTSDFQHLKHNESSSGNIKTARAPNSSRINDYQEINEGRSVKTKPMSTLLRQNPSTSSQTLTTKSGGERPEPKIGTTHTDSPRHSKIQESDSEYQLKLVNDIEDRGDVTANDLPSSGRRLKRSSGENKDNTLDFHKERRWEFMIGATIIANGLGVFITLLIQGIVHKIRHKRLRKLYGRKGSERHHRHKRYSSSSRSRSSSASSSEKPKESLLLAISHKLGLKKEEPKDKKKSGSSGGGSSADEKRKKTSKSKSDTSRGSPKKSGSPKKQVSGESVKSKASKASNASKLSNASDKSKTSKASNASDKSKTA